jgi:hypothetical protein
LNEITPGIRRDVKGSRSRLLTKPLKSNGLIRPRRRVFGKLMPEIKTEFLFTIDLDFEITVLGETPYGIRRVGRLITGSFGGPKLKGTVLPGGGAWTLVRRDDVLDIEVRLILETNDKHQIYMHWKGLRHVPKEVIERLRRNETVDPRTYYLRATPYFETSSEKFRWMNCICAIATGSLATNARTLDVFQVL